MSGARQQCGCSPWTGPSGFWREPGRGLEQARTQGNQHTLGFGDSRASRLVSVWFGFCSLLEAQVSVLKSKVTMTQLTRQHNPLLGSRNTFPAFISNCKSKQPPTYFLKLISSSLVTLKGFKSDQILCVCVCVATPPPSSLGLQRENVRGGQGHSILLTLHSHAFLHPGSHIAQLQGGTSLGTNLGLKVLRE